MTQLVFAITGASASGKTTLCHEVTAELKKKGHNVGMVTESARDSQYLHAGQRDLHMHIEVLGLHIALEARARRMYDVIIADRSIVDFLTFAQLRFPSLATSKNSPEFEALRNFVEAYEAVYEHIFVPGPYHLTSDTDTLREGDDISQHEMHMTTLSYLTARQLPFTELTQNTGRAGVVINYILATIEAKKSE